MEREELSQTVNKREHLGQIVDLRPKRYGKSGRVVELEIVGTDDIKLVKGLAIRRWLGLRENLFFVDKQLAPDGTVAAWVFTGGGWGHGVGLCQVGAYGMASAGYSYREILEHYYLGTEIRKVGEGGGQERE
jgi:stage II sporulation protein D